MATAPPGVPQLNSWQRNGHILQGLRAAQLEVTNLGNNQVPRACPVVGSGVQARGGCLFRPSVPRPRAVRVL